MPESQIAKCPLNPEWAYRDRVIAEEKFLWSKSEDGLSGQEIVTLFNEKFHRSVDLHSVERRLNRLKRTKAAMAEVGFIFFVFICFIVSDKDQSQKKTEG